MFENFMKLLWFYISGSNLITIPAGLRKPSLRYKAHFFELISNFSIEALEHCLWIVKWTIPLWLPFALTIVSSIEWVTLHERLIFYFVFIYCFLHIIRGLSRLSNASYRKFATLYLEAEMKRTDYLIESLTSYGFSHQWPTQFDVSDIDEELRVNRRDISHPKCTVSTFISPILWFLAHTIGVLIVYPGCIPIFNTYMINSRMKALDDLRVKFDAKRVGLRTQDGEFIEAYYVDSRETALAANAKILVICFEGNGGFAETGISSVPLSKGFSVLAWNHPGFGCSTALPYPVHETNSIETVVLFAIHKLNFTLENIRLFGWSIGGFSVTWAAMNFPNVGGLIIDATFDSLDILTESYVPSIFVMIRSVPVGVIQNHFNLNNAEQIVHYNGPILLIRRDNDEVISTCFISKRSTNRANFLLVAILKHRYPHLFTNVSENSLDAFLSLDASDQEVYLLENYISDVLMLPVLQKEFHKEAVLTAMSNKLIYFPSKLGLSGICDTMKRSLLLFLASKYFSEVSGTHRSPLNPDAFMEPWSESSVLINDKFLTISEKNIED